MNGKQGEPVYPYNHDGNSHEVIDNPDMLEQLTPLEVHTSEQLIKNKYVAWHALRGYDFAGLASILSKGLFPSANQQDYKVCLSASPTVSHDRGREASSFYAYTLGDGISIAFDLEPGTNIYNTTSYGGFSDEIRGLALETIRPERIVGIMIPESSASTKLSAVRTRREARKPKQMALYLSRTLDHISELGGDPTSIDPGILELIQRSVDLKEIVSEDISAQLEAQIMRCYSNAVRNKYGIEEPTIADMLAVLLKNYPVEVVVFTDGQKTEIGQKNAKFAMSKTNYFHLFS